MMVQLPKVSTSDLRGINQLTVAGIAGVVDIVEAMHRQIARPFGIGANRRDGRATGIARLVYGSIRGVTGLVGTSLDGLLAAMRPIIGEHSTWRGREPMIAALNGVLGDHLTASGNPLAIRMSMRRGGKALTLDRAALAATIPEATGKLVVLLHGLCMDDLQWTRKGHDHGAALARDLGYTPVYLQYNSGLHVSTNGQALATQLDALVHAWPVPLDTLVLVGYSMGGLVARSACHYGTHAGHEWRRRLDKLVFLGTPHQGAPLERGGNWIHVALGLSPYSAPLARLGKIRSAGITDLRFGSLVDEDWKEGDRFTRGDHRRAFLPLPEGVACFSLAGSLSTKEGRLPGRLLGDGLVPVRSALGRHANPRRSLAFEPSRQHVIHGANHLDLLDRPDVYDQLKRWLSE